MQSSEADGDAGFQFQSTTTVVHLQRIRAAAEAIYAEIARSQQSVMRDLDSALEQHAAAVRQGVEPPRELPALPYWLSGYIRLRQLRAEAFTGRLVIEVNLNDGGITGIDMRENYRLRRTPPISPLGWVTLVMSALV